MPEDNRKIYRPVDGIIIPTLESDIPNAAYWRSIFLNALVLGTAAGGSVKEAAAISAEGRIDGRPGSAEFFALDTNLNNEPEHAIIRYKIQERGGVLIAVAMWHSGTPRILKSDQIGEGPSDQVLRFVNIAPQKHMGPLYVS